MKKGQGGRNDSRGSLAQRSCPQHEPTENWTTIVNSDARLKQESQRKALKRNPLAQPFLKWACKRQLLAEIRKYTPSKLNRYYEPILR
jgi:hypothetical protein